MFRAHYIDLDCRMEHVPPAVSTLHNVRTEHYLKHTYWNTGLCGQPSLFASSKPRKICMDCGSLLFAPPWLRLRMQASEKARQQCDVVTIFRTIQGQRTNAAYIFWLL